ncbi:MAG: SRPBCC domain-containing protein [Bacteroidetes bacterium]|nr:SRPBCC domain-containing protein [Bacteroidota bacterium]
MKKIEVKAVIDRSPDLVWECFTNPKHICNWNFASLDWYCPTAMSELKPGGHFTYRMASRDGCMGFDFAGTFITVEREKHLCYKLGDDRQVDVVFFAEGERTLITETFDPETLNDAEMQKAGWQAILNNFKNYCQSQ